MIGTEYFVLIILVTKHLANEKSFWGITAAICLVLFAVLMIRFYKNLEYNNDEDFEHTYIISTGLICRLAMVFVGNQDSWF